MALFSAENPPITAIGHERRCVVVNRSGRRCGKWALKGCEACAAHGGYRERRKHPAWLLAGREVKRQVTRAVRGYGADELWQVEAFRRGHARHKLALLNAWLRSQEERDPGILTRAIDSVREGQKWISTASD